MVKQRKQPIAASRSLSTLLSPPKRRGNDGFTLLDLMIVLTIVGILSSIAIPSFRHLILKSQLARLEYRLYQLINTARINALQHHSITTLCPRGDGKCGQDWQAGLMLFQDKNNNREIDKDDRLIEVLQNIPREFSIKWRASAGRQYLRFSPNGITREFGRFHICHKEEDKSLNRSLVINRQGRLLSYKDLDGDGVVEDFNGNTPEC